MTNYPLSDFSVAITEIYKSVNKVCKSKELWANDELCLKVFGEFYKMLYHQIHRFLSQNKTDAKEKQIRQLLGDYVIGHKDAETNKTYLGMITILKKKIEQLEKARVKDDKVMFEYSMLYDNFYALAACRSMQHFALYMEWDLEPNKRIFNMTLNCFGGYWYYATQAVLNFTWQKIFSQAPTGYGKSYKDTVTMAFIFGYDLNADILKVTGNPANLASNSNRLIKYMLKPAYAKVFPYFAQFNCDIDKMFDIHQIGGNDKPTRLLIHGSDKGESLLFCNKMTPIDGNRYKYKFYDDVTKSKDKAKIHIHEQDVEMYKSEWERRKYNDFENLEFFSGTAYHNEDFLCTVKRMNGGDSAIRSNINKYTHTNIKTKSVFVQVPKLDYETDKITFPQMYSEESAKKKRDEDPREFYSMDQQEPMPIEGCPFDYKNIQTYTSIPHKKGGDMESTYAVLDPARTGANYVSMAICVKIDGIHYLKDVLFEMRPIEELHNEIVEKLIKHNVCQFHIERNTDTSLKTLLDKMCKERGYNNCTFSEIYTTKVKKDKIADNEASIRNNMCFPVFGMYGIGHQMRNFMRYFTGYSYLERNKYDDAPDAIAMYAEKFIRNRGGRAKAYLLDL